MRTDTDAHPGLEHPQDHQRHDAEDGGEEEDVAAVGPLEDEDLGRPAEEIEHGLRQGEGHQRGQLEAEGQLGPEAGGHPGNVLAGPRGRGHRRPAGAPAEPRDPPTDLPPVGLVVRPERAAEGRLLVGHDEDVEGDEDDGGPPEQPPGAEQQAAPGDDGHVGDVHRVPHHPVGAAPHDEAGRVDRRQRPLAFVGEAQVDAVQQQPAAGHHEGQAEEAAPAEIEPPARSAQQQRRHDDVDQNAGIASATVART